jgi:hypothetical protein
MAANPKMQDTRRRKAPRRIRPAGAGAVRPLGTSGAGAAGAGTAGAGAGAGTAAGAGTSLSTAGAGPSIYDADIERQQLKDHARARRTAMAIFCIAAKRFYDEREVHHVDPEQEDEL